MRVVGAPFVQFRALQGGKPLVTAPTQTAVTVQAEPKPEPEPEMEAKPAPPEHPKTWQTFRKIWLYTGDSNSRDIAATVKRRSETEAELTLQLIVINNAGDGYKKTCTVTLGEKFSWPASLRRYPPWAVGGLLPNLTVNGKTVTIW